MTDGPTRGKLSVGIDVPVEQPSQGPKILGAEALPQALALNGPLDQNRVDEH